MLFKDDLHLLVPVVPQRVFIAVQLISKLCYFLLFTGLIVVIHHLDSLMASTRMITVEFRSQFKTTVEFGSNRRISFTVQTNNKVEM
jgi:hypothetical protein